MESIIKSEMDEETCFDQEWKMKEETREDLELKIKEEILDVNCGNYICVDCGCTFEDEESLSTHMQSNSCKNLGLPKTEGYFTAQKITIEHEEVQCEEGGYITSIQYHLSNKNDKPFKCSGCTYSSTRKNTLLRHIRTVHKKEKPITCSECDYKCSDKRSIIRHITAAHNREKAFKCSECDYSFNYHYKLTIHNYAVHKNERPFKCSECDYRCSLNSNLNKHMSAVHKVESI